MNIDSLVTAMILLVMLGALLIGIGTIGLIYRIKRSAGWRRVARDAEQQRRIAATIRREREADRRDFARSYPVDLGGVRRNPDRVASGLASRIANDLRSVGTRTYE